MKRRKIYKKHLQNKWSMAMITLIIVMVMVVVYIQSQGLQAKKEEQQRYIDSLNEQIDEQDQITLDLEEQAKYMETKKYIEEVAKEKLGLVYEDEIIFKTE